MFIGREKERAKLKSKEENVVQEITIKRRDDTYINAKFYNSNKESTKGVVIVCHGFGEHSGSYREFSERLEQANYACVVFDQHGHGDLHNEKLLGTIPSYQSFLDDIKAVADDMKKRMPNIPIALFGHSMGGNIAVNYLLRENQSDFFCAILESPWLGLYKDASPLDVGMAKVFNHVLPNARLPKSRTTLPISKITSCEEKQQEIEHDRLYHNWMSWRLFLGVYEGCIYALNHASKLFIPTFLAVAKEDEIVSNKAMKKFYQACGTNVTAKGYAFRHAIHNDGRREIFYRDVIAFLDRNLS